MSKAKTKHIKAKKKPRKNYVVVSNSSYGKALKGQRIYFEGKKPTRLGDDGRITFGKIILEILGKKFGPRFRWTITEETDEIVVRYGITHVRTSKRMLDRMFGENFERSREVKNEIVQRRFFYAFPSQFTTPPPAAYVPGSIAKILTGGVLPKLSSEDKDAVNQILPDFLKAEAMSSIAIKAVEIDSLKRLATEFKAELGNQHPESWWQNYIQARILIMQQGYIRPVEKMNVAIGNTKFPDFALVTHDNYLDILEIKKPDTIILKEDKSRGNYHWDTEISRAIIQVENYLEHISNQAAQVRSFVKDTYGLELKVVRPRGFILAGNSAQFVSQKQRDDFRLLSHGLKNVTVITYDELLVRLENHIRVLEKYTSKNGDEIPSAS
ncbi:MAG TPA: Shedu immune nuclease family protein [Candidatus Acidoferrum sp.]|nr:Shedu immune nuclease family protein [Candidatus Acidoferrum sp.]